LSVDNGEAWGWQERNVSTPFLRIPITCECTDSLLHTHSPSKRRAMNGRPLIYYDMMSWRTSFCEGLLGLWVKRSIVMTNEKGPIQVYARQSLLFYSI